MYRRHVTGESGLPRGAGKCHSGLALPPAAAASSEAASKTDTLPLAESATASRAEPAPRAPGGEIQSAAAEGAKGSLITAVMSKLATSKTFAVLSAALVVAARQPSAETARAATGPEWAAYCFANSTTPPPLVPPRFLDQNLTTPSAEAVMRKVEDEEEEEEEAALAPPPRPPPPPAAPPPPPPPPPPADPGEANATCVTVSRCMYDFSYIDAEGMDAR